MPKRFYATTRPIALPAIRDDDGIWQIYDEADIRRMGFTETARRFRTINDRLETVEQGKSLQERIDERGKLTKQALGNTGYLIVFGAGGKHVCAACIPLAGGSDLAVDQTLYWQVIQNEEQAWFRIGILNSHAMTEAIMPFNPKGDFGERHIHALPYRLMPAYDPSNEDHERIAILAQQVTGQARAMVVADDYLWTIRIGLCTFAAADSAKLFRQPPNFRNWNGSALPHLARRSSKNRQTVPQVISHHDRS